MTGAISTRDDFPGGRVECDVVVVGSGAGGAVAAAELAEGGLDVVVVEEGSHHPTESFTGDDAAMIRALYRDGGLTAALGRPPVAYNEGRCIGGSTVVNGAMSWRTPERVIERWRTDEGMSDLTPASLEPWFERVERFLSVGTPDAESIGVDQQLMKRGADQLGWRVVESRRAHVHCAGCNRCVFGCPTGAKQSTLVSYLPRAMHFGAQIYADCRVERICFRGKRAVGVRGHVLDERGKRRSPFEVRARAVVVSCGAIHTPGLLQRSRFRSPSKRVGQGLTLHPGAQVTAVFDEVVEGWKGVHQAYQVREFEDQGVILAAVNLPPSLVARSLGLTGRELGRAMDDYPRMVSAGVLVEDTTTGRVRSVGNRPVAFYETTQQDARRVVDAIGKLSEMLFAAGAQRIYPPLASARQGL